MVVVLAAVVVVVVVVEVARLLIVEGWLGCSDRWRLLLWTLRLRVVRSRRSRVSFPWRTPAVPIFERPRW